LKCEMIWKIRKIQKKMVKRYDKYGRKVSWIVKWYLKQGRKARRRVKRYGHYGRNPSWIVKRNWKYEEK
jgi:hypothetical protein